MAAAGQSKGFSVKLSTFSTPLEFQQIASVIKSQLKAINIDVDIVAQEPGTFAANNGVGNFEWDLTARGMRGDVDGYLNEYNPAPRSTGSGTRTGRTSRSGATSGTARSRSTRPSGCRSTSRRRCCCRTTCRRSALVQVQQVPGRAQARPGHVRRVRRLQHGPPQHGVAQLVTDASFAGRERRPRGAPPGRMFCATIL